jgi:glycosyltransferase involved in cell wall biosynthesis
MISVLMPVYNGDKYIADSINSIIGQSFRQFELLIYDDASVDKTRSIIQKFIKKDSRVKLFYGKKNIKQPNALNYLLTKANYDLIALNDSDDISHPQRLLKQLIFLQGNKNIGMVGTYANIINENAKLIRKIKYPLSSKLINYQLSVSNCFAQSSVMFRKKILKKVGFFREIFDPAQDYDMWCRLSLHTNLANLPEYLIDYREHFDSSSNLRRDDIFFKSQFIKINYKFQKKKKDLIEIRNIKTIDKCLIEKKLQLKQIKLMTIKREYNFSQIAYNFKIKNISKFLIIFLDLFIESPKYMLKKIFEYYHKSS